MQFFVHLTTLSIRRMQTIVRQSQASGFICIDTNKQLDRQQMDGTWEAMVICNAFGCLFLCMERDKTSRNEKTYFLPLQLFIVKLIRRISKVSKMGFELKENGIQLNWIKKSISHLWETVQFTIVSMSTIFWLIRWDCF